jgi:endonuclease III
VFDIHVRRVFLRTGIARYDEQTHMVRRARELNPARPGALDQPAWWLGHEWCRASDPRCSACPIERSCPKLIDRAVDVASG